MRRPILALALIVLFGSVAIVQATWMADQPDVVISEVAWMGTTTSSSDEWIELFNNTANTLDLTGWTLSDSGDISITLENTIPPGGYYLLERTNDDTVPGVDADHIYSGGLSNDGENLVLRDDASNIIDRVDCSSGWFAGHADARVPMVRVDTLADGGLVSNWTHNPRCGSATNSAGNVYECPIAVAVTDHALDYAVYFNGRAITATTTTTATTPMEDALLDLINGADTDYAVFPRAYFRLIAWKVYSAQCLAPGFVAKISVERGWTKSSS